MTMTLRDALERLDESIDRLEQAADTSLEKRTRQSGVQTGPRNRAEVIGKLDAMIGRLESFLSPEPAAPNGKR